MWHRSEAGHADPPLPFETRQAIALVALWAAYGAIAAKVAPPEGVPIPGDVDELYDALGEVHKVMGE